MLYLIWAIAFTVVGVLLGATWVQAYNQCREDKKWIMLTPLWMFTATVYKENGKEIRKKSLIYVGLAIVFTVLFLSGIVTK